MIDIRRTTHQNHFPFSNNLQTQSTLLIVDEEQYSNTIFLLTSSSHSFFISK